MSDRGLEGLLKQQRDAVALLDALHPEAGSKRAGLRCEFAIGEPAGFAVRPVIEKRGPVRLPGRPAVRHRRADVEALRDDPAEIAAELVVAVTPFEHLSVPL